MSTLGRITDHEQRAPMATQRSLEGFVEVVGVDNNQVDVPAAKLPCDDSLVPIVLIGCEAGNSGAGKSWNSIGGSRLAEKNHVGAALLHLVCQRQAPHNVAASDGGIGVSSEQDQHAGLALRSDEAFCSMSRLIEAV
jgi:hypothetical protein